MVASFSLDSQHYQINLGLHPGICPAEDLIWGEEMHAISEPKGT